MLVRVARRQRRIQLSRTHFAQDNLPLPWLCPALTKWRAHTTAVTAINPHDLRKSQSATPVTRRDIRPLATAAPSFASAVESIPYHSLPQPSPYGDASVPFAPRSGDTSNLIVIPNHLHAAPRLNYRQGVGGAPHELLQNLYASVRVGRLDRAAVVVSRISEIYTKKSPELLVAHNTYLEALMKSILAGNPELSYQNLYKWYCTKTLYDVVPDEKTLTVMIRAAVATLDGFERDEAVNYILSQAEMNGIFDDTFYSEDYSDDDIEVLDRLRPETIEKDEAQMIQEVQASDTYPDVKSTAQKGLGLFTLKKSLAGLNDTTPENESDAATKMDLYAKQIKLEEDAVEAAIERWRKERDEMKKMGVKGASQSASINTYMARWFTALTAALDEEMKKVKDVLAKPTTNDRDADRKTYGPYMELFTTEKLAAVTILSILDTFATPDREGQLTKFQVVYITMKLGKILEQEHAMSLMAPDEPRQEGGHLARKTAAHAKLRTWQKLKRSRSSRDSGADVTRTDFGPHDCHDIPAVVKVKLGAILLEKLTEVATIDVFNRDSDADKSTIRTQPAFSHTASILLGKKVGQISAHHVLIAKLRKEPVRAQFAGTLPMLVEPQPWSGIKKGGYLKYPLSVMRFRTKDETQMTYAKSAAMKGDMDMVFAGLNVLGKTPWRVNRNVLDVMVDAWNTGESIGKLAPENPDLPIPPEPAADAGFRARRQWLNEVRDIENKRTGYHSNRCFQNFQVEIARSFRDSTFYFPHNLDFRGRAYPIPPILNHMGADNARGLLAFGTGKELGEVGLKWLKVHLANLYGFDKANFIEREKFTMDHLEDVRDSARNPLNGKRWWTKAEDPWQCLAACFEITNALDTPNPEQFVSYLPVHQDGTCNGLQHYAALGGDPAGAAQVNLIPGDRPADVYTAVAEIVKAKVRAKALEGDEIALMLQGVITRKVVKQTVMTNVYGVTFFGAVQQVKKQLKDLFPEKTSREDTLQIHRMAHKTAFFIFQALGTLFTGAQQIQHWLAECASRITNSLSPEQMEQIELEAAGGPSTDPKYKQRQKNKRGSKGLRSKRPADLLQSTLVWTTPLKMPVVQPYRQDSARIINTSLQTLTLREATQTDPVNKRKQIQGFPPNFVHSLDATHMLLSALKSDEAGLTFAAVHDSFWTHAADIPKLNTILRDAFVRMHSDDVVGRLAEELRARYGSNMIHTPIDLRSQIGKEIVAWRADPKNGNPASTDELVLERKRQQLLKSTDPEQQKEGQALMTPTRIYEDGVAAGKSFGSASKTRPALGDRGKFPREIIPDKVDADASEDSKSGVSATTSEALNESDIQANSSDYSMESKSFASNSEFSDDFDMALEDEHDEAPYGDGFSNQDGTFEPRKKKRVSQNKPTHVWTHISFPPVPQKGSFDVTQLRESQYFFS